MNNISVFVSFLDIHLSGSGGVKIAPSQTTINNIHIGNCHLNLDIEQCCEYSNTV